MRTQQREAIYVVHRYFPFQHQQMLHFSQILTQRSLRVFILCYVHHQDIFKDRLMFLRCIKRHWEDRTLFKTTRY